MSKANQIISQKFEDVRHCMAELAKRNLTITGIEIKDGRPRITIIGLNKSPGGLVGGTMTRIKMGHRRMETYATNLHNCQVQWKVPA